jgi:putative nucleotidyltransferase with HDIG domain
MAPHVGGRRPPEETDGMHATLEKHPRLLPAFESALSVYDPGTARHCVRVEFVSSRIGEVLGLAPAAAEALAWAALLHDLGKMSVSRAILEKAGPLDEWDWEEIKRHPAIGAEFLLAISDRLAPIAEGIRSHHERWDGAGYPDGLAGEAIPLLGRIITVADVYDALRSPRPYRGWIRSEPEAAAFVEAGAGTAFDPHVVDVFADLYRRGQLESEAATRGRLHGSSLSVR